MADVILPGERRASMAEQAALEGRSYTRSHLHWKDIGERGRPPPREWAIDQWLGMGHVTYLAGTGGLGKSVIAQQIGTAVAAGLPFIGNTPQPRVTLAWMGEDDARELEERQFAICDHFQLRIECLQDRLYVESMSRTECSLFDYAAGQLIRTSMLRELRDQVGDYRAELVILDNASCVFGANENDRHHVKAFFSALSWAAAPTNAAILLLGHTAKTENSEYSGSTAWENSCRARLWFSDHPPDKTPDPTEDGDGKEDLRYLSRRKANYTARDLAILRYHMGAYEIVTAPAADGINGYARLQRSKTIALDGLLRLKTMGLDPTDGRSSPNFLPRLIIQHGLASGYTSAELDRGMRLLMTDGAIVRRQIGVGDNRHPRFGLSLP